MGVGVGVGVGVCVCVCVSIRNPVACRRVADISTQFTLVQTQ